MPWRGQTPRADLCVIGGNSLTNDMINYLFNNLL